MVLFNLLRRRKRYSIGIDIGHSALKVVVLKTGEGREKVEKWYLTEFPQGALVKGRVENEGLVLESLRELVRQEILPKGKVVTAVVGGGAEVKKVRLPPGSRKDLDRYIAVEAEQVFSQPFLSLVLDYAVLREEADYVDVLVAGVPRDRVTIIKDLFQKAGIEIHVLDVKPLALYHLFSYLGGDDYKGLSVVVDVGQSVTTVLLVNNGELLCAREVFLGGDVITEMIQRKEGLSYAQAERFKKEKLSSVSYEMEVLDKFVVSLGHELRLSLDSCRMLLSPGEDEVKRLFYTGGGASLENFGKAFEERFDVEVKNVYHLGPRDGIEVEGVDNLDRFSVVLGLAIRGAVA